MITTRPSSCRLRPAAVPLVLAMLAGLQAGCSHPAGATAPADAVVAESQPTRALRERVEAHLRATHGMEGAGQTVELTIEPALQKIAEEEVLRLAQMPKTRLAVMVVIDPATGEVLAMSGKRPDGDDPDAPARVAFEPGSVMKVFSIAAALERGTVRVGQTFSGENGRWQYGGEPVHDATAHGTMSVDDVVAFSSNVGATKIFETLGKEPLSQMLVRVGFGTRPAVQLADATPGSLENVSTWSDARAATIACGEGLRASPLQIASAFAAIANLGTYNAPTLVRRVVGVDHRVSWQHHPAGERVLDTDTARTMLGLLERAVDRDDATGKAARIPGRRVAGKTGTAGVAGPDGKDAEGETYASFMGAIPADRPRLVIYVGVHTAAAGYAGGTIAAPAFARVGGKMLALR